MVKSTYGHEIQSNNDQYNTLAAEAFEAVNSLGIPGMTTMDLIPICTEILAVPCIRYLLPD